MLGYTPIDCDTSGVDACAMGKRIQTAARRGPKVHANYARQGPTAARCIAYLCIVLAEAQSCICAGTLHALLLSRLSLNKFKAVKDGDYVKKLSSDFKSVTTLRDI